MKLKVIRCLARINIVFIRPKKCQLYYTWVLNRGVCLYVIVRLGSHMLIVLKKWSLPQDMTLLKWNYLIFTNLSVREITKSSSTFSATNIGSNKVWFHQLHDTIQMKSNYIWINYSHDNLAIRSHIMIYNFVLNLFFVTKFSSIYLARGEKRLVFRLSSVNLQRAKDGTHMCDAKYRYVFVA